MSDRFRFRVWSEEDCGYMESNDIFRLTHSGKLVFNNDSLNREPECNPKRYICEQCTGLKDKNGQLIYEGDILKSTYSEIMQYRIYWEGRGYRMRVYGSDNKIVDDCPIFINAADVLEVIGNIHENADLLEVGGK